MRPTLHASLRILDRAVLLAIYVASLWLLLWWDLEVAMDRKLYCNVTAGTTVTAIVAYAAVWCSSFALASPYGTVAPIERTVLAALFPIALVDMAMRSADVRPQFGPGEDLFFAWAVSRDASFVILLGGPLVLLFSLVDVYDHGLPPARIVRVGEMTIRRAVPSRAPS
jgi:hypothetical protein